MIMKVGMSLTIYFVNQVWLGNLGRILLVILFVASLFVPWVVPAASASISSCNSPYNISNSPGATSAYPFLLADNDGRIHLFWSEKTMEAAGNVPDTVLYAVWQEGIWSETVDLFLSPAEIFNMAVGNIRGIVDDNGRIHLIWSGPDNTFFYSSAYAAEAANAQVWLSPVLLSNVQTGTQFSVDIAYESPDILHIIYGQDPPRANRTVSHIRSVDGGATWSAPVDIHAFPDVERGASNTRVHVDPFHDGHVYATWTEWDQTGNGQVVYFARSPDSGVTWQRPVPLAIRVGNEYQRDWANLAALDEDTLMVFWSGGFRAYPQAQYSYDGGFTWSDPIDTLYWLIADNGYAQFIRDSEGDTHLFITRRIREGYGYKCAALAGCQGEGNAIWHSKWQGGTSWSEPEPVGGFQYGNYVSVAYDGGSRIFLSWFLFGEFDIHVMDCQMEGLQVAEPSRYPSPTPATTATPDINLISGPVVQPTPEPGYREIFDTSPSDIWSQPNMGNMLFLSITPSIMILLAVVFLKRRYG
jgi:hypothetical protein